MFGRPRLPRLAFVFHHRPFSILALTAAAHGVCELVWVLDNSSPELAPLARALHRFGTVVDVGGASVAEAASRIEATDPQGILSLSDASLHWTSLVANLLSLPHVAPEVARALTDKDAQRAALAAGGVPGPGFWRVPAAGDEAGWEALARMAVFPAVLKPRRGDSGRGVMAVASLEEARTLVRAGVPGVAAGTPLMLEEYLADRSDRAGPFADVVSVESAVCGGRITHLATTGRFPFAAPFRETGSFIPSALGELERDAALTAATAAITALGIDVGCQHIELKMTPAGPRVIEVNGRVGAGVPDMLGAVAEVDLLALAMRLALGEEVAIDPMPRCQGVVYVLMPQAPVSMRTVAAVEGLDRVRADPRVSRVILRRGPGEQVDWRDGYWGHVFSVEGVVPDHGELASLAAFVDTEVRIVGA